MCYLLEPSISTLAIWQLSPLPTWAGSGLAWAGTFMLFPAKPIKVMGKGLWRWQGKAWEGDGRRLMRMMEEGVWGCVGPEIPLDGKQLAATRKALQPHKQSWSQQRSLQVTGEARREVPRGRFRVIWCMLSCPLAVGLEQKPWENFHHPVLLLPPELSAEVRGQAGMEHPCGTDQGEPSSCKGEDFQPK